MGAVPGRIGLLLVAVLTALAALSPPLDAAAHERLSAHMAQHLLLGMVAAPLLAGAGPIGLALRRLPRRHAQALARALRAPLARRLVHPAVTTFAFAGTLAVVHLPAVYGAAIAYPLLHAVEHAALFWTAVLWWLPLVGRDPIPRAGGVARLAAGMLAMAAMVLVGGVISSNAAVLYPAYLHGGATPEAAALADQQTAGAMMSIGGMVVMLPVLLWSIWRALVTEERKQRAREAVPDA